MPSHLKALLVILFLASLVFVFAKGPVCAVATTAKDFERRRNLWFCVTLIAFLAHNYWVYIVGVAVILLAIGPREPNKIAMYFFLLFALPEIPQDIGGLGLINYFFTIDYIRLLALAILLPAYLSLRKRPDVATFGSLLPDKLLIGYHVLIILLMANATSFTNLLRQGVFYPFLDVFLPYYVVSRSLKDVGGFRDALTGFVMAALVLSAIGAFESSRHWLLYSALDEALDAPWVYGRYLMREGAGLRALATAGQPIPLGFVIAVAVGLYLFLMRSVASANLRKLVFAVLLVGLVAPVSRGPWVGAVVMILVFVLTGPSAATRIAKLGLAGLVATSVALMSPFGEKLLGFLPFIGNVEDDNVVFRQRLLSNSINVILDNPFFGSFESVYSEAMQELKSASGLIDIVNTYVAVALGSGLVGLSLFVGFFVVVVAGVFKAMRQLQDKDDEQFVLGQALLATLVGILVIIFTVSSITIIPVTYWSVAGLAVGYAQMRITAKIQEPIHPSVAQAGAMRKRA